MQSPTPAEQLRFQREYDLQYLPLDHYTTDSPNFDLPADFTTCQCEEEPLPPRRSYPISGRLYVPPGQIPHAPYMLDERPKRVTAFAEALVRYHRYNYIPAAVYLDDLYDYDRKDLKAKISDRYIVARVTSGKTVDYTDEEANNNYYWAGVYHKDSAENFNFLEDLNPFTEVPEPPGSFLKSLVASVEPRPLLQEQEDFAAKFNLPHPYTLANRPHLPGFADALRFIAPILKHYIDDPNPPLAKIFQLAHWIDPANDHRLKSLVHKWISDPSSEVEQIVDLIGKRRVPIDLDSWMKEKKKLFGNKLPKDLLKTDSRETRESKLAENREWLLQSSPSIHLADTPPPNTMEPGEGTSMGQSQSLIPAQGDQENAAQAQKNAQLEEMSRRKAQTKTEMIQQMCTLAREGRRDLLQIIVSDASPAWNPRAMVMRVQSMVKGGKTDDEILLATTNPTSVVTPHASNRNSTAAPNADAGGKASQTNVNADQLATDIAQKLSAMMIAGPQGPMPVAQQRQKKVHHSQLPVGFEVIGDEGRMPFDPDDPACREEYPDERFLNESHPCYRGDLQLKLPGYLKPMVATAETFVDPVQLLPHLHYPPQPSTRSLEKAYGQWMQMGTAASRVDMDDSFETYMKRFEGKDIPTFVFEQLAAMAQTYTHESELKPSWEEDGDLAEKAAVENVEAQTQAERVLLRKKALAIQAELLRRKLLIPDPAVEILKAPSIADDPVLREEYEQLRSLDPVNFEDLSVIEAYCTDRSKALVLYKPTPWVKMSEKAPLHSNAVPTIHRYDEAPDRAFDDSKATLWTPPDPSLSKLPIHDDGYYDLLKSLSGPLIPAYDAHHVKKSLFSGMAYIDFERGLHRLRSDVKAGASKLCTALRGNMVLATKRNLSDEEEQALSDYKYVDTLPGPGNYSCYGFDGFNVLSEIVRLGEVPDFGDKDFYNAITNRKAPDGTKRRKGPDDQAVQENVIPVFNSHLPFSKITEPMSLFEAHDIHERGQHAAQQRVDNGLSSNLSENVPQQPDDGQPEGSAASSKRKRSPSQSYTWTYGETDDAERLYRESMLLPFPHILEEDGRVVRVAEPMHKQNNHTQRQMTSPISRTRVREEDSETLMEMEQLCIQDETFPRFAIRYMVKPAPKRDVFSHLSSRYGPFTFPDLDTATPESGFTIKDASSGETYNVKEHSVDEEFDDADLTFAVVWPRFLKAVNARRQIASGIVPGSRIALYEEMEVDLANVAHVFPSLSTPRSTEPFPLRIKKITSNPPARDSYGRVQKKDAVTSSPATNNAVEEASKVARHKYESYKAQEEILAKLRKAAGDANSDFGAIKRDRKNPPKKGKKRVSEVEAFKKHEEILSLPKGLQGLLMSMGESVADIERAAGVLADRLDVVAEQSRVVLCSSLVAIQDQHKEMIKLIQVFHATMDYMSELIEDEDYAKMKVPAWFLSQVKEGFHRCKCRLCVRFWDPKELLKDDLQDVKDLHQLRLVGYDFEKFKGVREAEETSKKKQKEQQQPNLDDEIDDAFDNGDSDEENEALQALLNDVCTKPANQWARDDFEFWKSSQDDLAFGMSGVMGRDLAFKQELGITDVMLRDVQEYYVGPGFEVGIDEAGEIQYDNRISAAYKSRQKAMLISFGYSDWGIPDDRRREVLDIFSGDHDKCGNQEWHTDEQRQLMRQFRSSLDVCLGVPMTYDEWSKHVDDWDVTPLCTRKKAMNERARAYAVSLPSGQGLCAIWKDSDHVQGQPVPTVAEVVNVMPEKDTQPILDPSIYETYSFVEGGDDWNKAYAEAKTSIEQEKRAKINSQRLTAADIDEMARDAASAPRTRLREGVRPYIACEAMPARYLEFINHYGEWLQFLQLYPPTMRSLVSKTHFEMHLNILEYRRMRKPIREILKDMEWIRDMKQDTESGYDIRDVDMRPSVNPLFSTPDIDLDAAIPYGGYDADAEDMLRATTEFDMLMIWLNSGYSKWAMKDGGTAAVENVTSAEAMEI